MNLPKALLLDFDDTLLDNSGVPAAVERACAEIAGLAEMPDAEELLRANLAAWKGYWPEAEQRCWVGEAEALDVSREVWRRALHACGLASHELVTAAFDIHQRIEEETLGLFEDASDLLAALQEAGIATGLVTNSSSQSQAAKLAGVHLEGAFDVVVISAEVGVAKPDPAIFDFALGWLGLTRADVWHVGDGLSTDVAGAAAAGIRSVWLNRHKRRPDPADPVPDLEIFSLWELCELIRAR